MSDLYLYLDVDKKAALIRGETRAGYMRVKLTPELMAPLLAEEREYLARYVGDADEKANRLRLSVEAAHETTIVEAVRAEHAEHAEEARKKDEREARLAARFKHVQEVERDALVYLDLDAKPGIRWSWRPVDQIMGEDAGYGAFSEKVREEAGAEARARNDREAEAEDARLLAEPVSGHVRLSGESYITTDAVLAHAGRYLYPRALARAKAYAKVRNEEREAEQAEREAELGDKFHEAILGFLSPEQRERLEAMVLPVDERDRTVRNALFAGLDQRFQRYKALGVDDIVHTAECEERQEWAATSPKVSVDIDETNDFEAIFYADEESWRVLKALRGYTDGMGAHWTTTRIYRQHEVTCRDCKAEATRLGVRVTVDLFGHKYSREYMLREKSGTEVEATAVYEAYAPDEAEVD